MQRESQEIAMGVEEYPKEYQEHHMKQASQNTMIWWTPPIEGIHKIKGATIVGVVKSWITEHISLRGVTTNHRR